MNLEIRQNKHMFEVELDQKTDKYKMCCSIFAPYTNLAYNTWKLVTMDLVDRDVDLAIEEWTLDLKRWWKYKSNNELVSRTNLNNRIECSKDEKMFDTLLDNNYAIQVSFYANKEFIKNIKDDWIIQINNYKDFVWKDYAHTFNICKRWDSYYVMDTVFVQVNRKDVEIDNINEFKKFLNPTCFCFI